ncbi:hypothetical protein GJAV_G00203540 [Gymnothorax javanicus]|nr:hypothetical protein GJAV_G00203540 [Gymnothorax javanicus]
MNAVFDTESEASAAIAEFESHSKTRFMVRTVPKGFGTLDYAQTKNHYVVFEDKSCVPKIEFDGIPFMILGRKVLHCHRGRDYHKKIEKSSENNRDFKRRKLQLQNTKKIGCTARIVMRDILIFPSHKVSTPSEWRRKCASQALRKSIAKSEAAGTRRIVVTFPQQSDHLTKCISECCESGRGRGGDRKKSRIHQTAGTSPQNRRDREGDSERVRRQQEKIAMEEKIASFFEERPFFYDEAHEDYKNKDRRNAELAEFATVIGSDAGTVWKRFASNRTDYRKLKNLESSESGQGAKKLTNLQKFKLTRYKFLDAHIMPRGYSEEMEEVASSLASIVGDDDDGEDDNNDDDLARPSAPRQGQQRSIWTESEGCGRSVNTKRQEVVDLLSQMLEDNRQKEAEAEKTTEAVAAEKPQNECEMWGSWLSIVAREIPAESWRSFQHDTLEVALRYLPPEGLPALPRTLGSSSSHQLRVNDCVSEAATATCDHPIPWLWFECRHQPRPEVLLLQHDRQTLVCGTVFCWIICDPPCQS